MENHTQGANGRPVAQPQESSLHTNQTVADRVQKGQALIQQLCDGRRKADTDFPFAKGVCPQSQCFLRTYASILPTSLSVPFSMYQSILCLGTWCGDEYGLQLGFGLVFGLGPREGTESFVCSNNTPGFCFIAHNSHQWQYVRRAAFFNLVPPLRITRKVERHKPQQSRSCGLWWKESSPWEDWFVTWQVFRISTEKKVLSDFFEFIPTCNFFLEYDPRFSVAPFQL